MKRIFYIFISLCLPLAVAAQDEFDALRLNQLDITGTARYTSMAGAFSALGGDVSAIKDNPAALGVFRMSETSVTMDFNTTLTSGVWNGQQKNQNNFKMPFAQASFVLNYQKEGKTKGLVSSNFAFHYNRLKTFNRRLDLSSEAVDASLTDFMAAFTGNTAESELAVDEPFDNTNVGWMSVLGYQGYLINPNTDNTWSSLLGGDEQVTPSYSMYESGYVNEYGFSWGGNISNMFYIGASLNIRSMDYSLQTVYSESFGAGGGLSLENSLHTTGAGFNFGVGVIARPVNFLRVALAVQTPTLLSLTDVNYADMGYSSLDVMNDSAAVEGTISTPEGRSYYNMRTPLKVNAGVAFVLGKKGLVSLEYNYDDYKNMQLRSDDGNSADYAVENNSIKTTLNSMHTLKLGAEMKLMNNWAVRAGVAYQTAATKSEATKYLPNILQNTIRTDMEYWHYNGTTYASAGFGYRDVSWYLDFAYQYKLQQENFYAFDTTLLTKQITAADVTTTHHNVVVTLGFKF